jgi:type IV pilus assembly protein PilC
MPRYRYIALDATGKEIEGILDAETQSDAVHAIRTRGLFPTQIIEAGGAIARKPVVAAVETRKRATGIQLKLPRLFARRVKTKHLMAFTRQLATLVDAGLPLLRSLRILSKQEKHPVLRDAIDGLSESVEGGSTFSEALSLYPKIFDDLYVNMVRAGEAGGVLESVLKRLAEFMEKSERIRRKVIGAMIYPVVVLVVAVSILSFLLIKVIPKYEQVFRDMLEGKSLPPLTQFVINVSRTVSMYWYYVVGFIIMVIIIIRILRRTERGAFALDNLKINFPIFGPLFRKAAIARFSRTLGTLMTSGVPVLQALNIVRDTAGNMVIASAIQQVHDSVKEGENMAGPLEVSGVFPPIVVSMVDVGEETGALPEMLMRIADNYDEEVDAAVAALTSIIEPLMIIALAFIVGTIVIAMFYPLVTLITELAK